MASHQPPPYSKIDPFGATAPRSHLPSFPKPEPVVIELAPDDLVDEGTRPIQVASIHNPGMAAPFTPPSPRPEPVMLPPATPGPSMDFGTMPSVAWQQPPSQQYPQQPPSQQYQSQQPPQSQQPQYVQQWQPSTYPSTAPTAMDVSTVQPQFQPRPPKKSRVGLILGVIAGLGLFFTLGVGGAGVAYYKLYMEPSEDSTAQASVQHSNTTTSTNPTTSFDPPPLATNATNADTAKVAPAPVIKTAPAVTTPTTTWKPAPVATTPRGAKADPAPKADAKVDAKADAKTEPKKTEDAKADAPKEEGGTGTVRSYTAEAGKPILIDGSMAGVAPAPLTVKCGSHSIQVGSAAARNVNVPCGGAVTVGSPDGT